MNLTQFWGDVEKLYSIRYTSDCYAIINTVYVSSVKTEDGSIF